MTENATVQKGTNYAWVVAFTGFVGQLIALMIIQSWGLNMSFIAEEFGVQPTDLAIGASLFGALYSGLSVFWGNLADKIGLRKAMSISAFGVSCALLITGFFASSQLFAIIGYAIAGCFIGALGASIAPKIVSAWFATNSRGKGSAVVIVGGSLGGVLLGVVGPMMIASGGWRGCFIGLGVLALIVAVLLVIFMRDSPASIGAQPYGIEKEKGTIADQKTVQAAIDNESNLDRMKRILKLPDMWKMAIIFILYQIYYAGHTTFFISALMGAGYSVEVAGLMSSITYVGICVGQLFFPTLSDRFARKYILGGTLLCAGIIYTSLYFIVSMNLDLPILITFMVFSGVLFACNAMMQVTMTELFPPDLRGAGPGMVNTFGLVGKFFGPVVLAAFITGVMGGNIMGYPLFTGPCAVIAALIALITLPKTSGKYGDPIAEKYYNEIQETAAKGEQEDK